MKIEIISAQKVEQSGEQHWFLATEVDRGDGVVERIAHIMPVDTFEWRAAEYGIDPADFDTLLDIVIHEPYLPPLSPSDPPLLMAAPTVKSAREEHLARIADLRGKDRVVGRKGLSPFAAGADAVVISDSGTEDPIAVLKRDSPMSATHITAKRAHVAQARSDHAQKRLATPQVRPRFAAGHASPELLSSDTTEGPTA